MKNQCSSKLKVHSLAILLLLSIVVYWVLFYFLLELFFSWLRVAIHPILLHVASALLGLALFAFVMAQVGKYMKPKRISYFQTIIQAIRQMAKGNFEINLDIPLPTDQKSRHNPFVQLVDSVHYMAKELGQLERVRQEFISNVSHEIQSPLTSIKGFARALENDRLPENKRMHYLNIIQKEADRLSKLSDNLMKLTALENTKHPIRLSNYRLDRQIRSCLLALEPQWTKKALDMTIELDPITIDADIDLMNQVWMNLIHNSIKFTPEHGKLQVELSIRDGRIMFCLSDTGIGIKKEDFVHLFERFYKADRSRTRRQEGNGLGLSIVKKIIEVHHGEIHVQSEYQKGTRVTILLNMSG